MLDWGLGGEFDRGNQGSGCGEEIDERRVPSMVCSNRTAAQGSPCTDGETEVQGGQITQDHPVKAKALERTTAPAHDLSRFVPEGHWCPQRAEWGHQGRVLLAWDLQHLVSLGPGSGPASCVGLEEQEVAPSGLPARICLSPW